MKAFLEIPLMLWFLLSVGLQAAIQISFMIKFSKVHPKKYYYFLFVGVAYIMYIGELVVPFQFNLCSSIINRLIGVGIICIFSRIVIKQNGVTSMAMGVLLITTNVLIESLIAPIQSILITLFSITNSANTIISGILILVTTYAFLYFFSTKYNLKSNSQSNSLLMLVIPMFFIGIVMEMLIETRYFPDGANYDQLSQVVLQQNYEVLGLSVFAFLCVCGMLYAYEKMALSFVNEQQKQLLLNELELQQKYVDEAKARYDSTRIFRHDLKNHIITLSGMLEKNETEKAVKYLERFEVVSDYISFPISTGNMVIDIILNEKLSYAKTVGIHVEYDISIPSTVYIEDFDLSVIFSNGIDNAIRACSHVTKGKKIIDIVAKQNKDFFVLDMINTYESGNVPSGSGLGLTSIRMIVDKYQGAVEIISEKETFRLSVLLPFWRLRSE